MAVLTKADVKPFLSMQQTDNDALVEDVIDQAEAYVVRRCGPLSSTATTRRLTARGCRLILPVLPVVSLTSVTAVESGDVVTIEDDDQNLTAGILGSSALIDGELYTVVWQAGHSPLPADLKRAVIEMCRYLWRPQRGGGVRGGEQDQMAALRLAETLMEPYLMPGFA